MQYTSNHPVKASGTLSRMSWDCHLPTSLHASMGRLWQRLRLLQIKMQPQMLLNLRTCQDEVTPETDSVEGAA